MVQIDVYQSADMADKACKRLVCIKTVRWSLCQYSKQFNLHVESAKVLARYLDQRQLEFPVKTNCCTTLDFMANNDIREHQQTCCTFSVNTDAPTYLNDLYSTVMRVGAGYTNLYFGANTADIP